MARIVHIALKVPDLEAATRFYCGIFDFHEVETKRRGEHVSRHLTDGYLDLSLMQYDSEDSHEAQLSGPGPCIHHWGIEVDDRDAYARKIEDMGGKVLSDPKVRALKFRAPDGTVAEIVRTGRYERNRS
ncbi:MAG: VOC family protein [Alphaproteobacteria bacterium]|nr:VOC family protein [Alphaproteobacteria bacterium]